MFADSVDDVRIGVRSSTAAIPNRFSFTKFAKLAAGALFQDLSLPISRLIAAGTTDGPILLFAITRSSISNVCLLCGHSVAVTDIRQIASQGTFLSVDCDGTLCVWSNTDGTLQCSIPRVSPPGDVRITPSEDAETVWVWTVGFDAKRISAKGGAVLNTLNVIGLTGLALLLPGTSIFVESAILFVCQANYCSPYRTDGTKIAGSCFPVNCNWGHSVHASEFGVVETVGNEWAILSPRRYDELRRGVAGRDAISCVAWSDSTTVCLGSFSGEFSVLTISFSDTVSILSHRTVTRPQLCFVSDFMISKTKIVFSPGRGRIDCLSLSGRLVSSGPSRESVCHVSKEGLTLERVSDRQFKCGDFLYETDANITAMTSRHGGAEFVVGTSMGCVLFYERGNSVPYRRTEIFPEPAVGFANLPRIRGRAAMLVIGAQGTVALVRHVTVLMVYASIEFPVRRLYLVEELSCVTVERCDGSFMTFPMLAPAPVAVGAAPPSRARLVWESTSLEVDSGAASVRYF
jgi:hypothetical protein